MKIIDRLENLDIDTLDAFEQTVYNDYIQHMDKVNALNRIINNADGDYTQLSDCHAEIAEYQENEQKLKPKSKNGKFKTNN